MAILKIARLGHPVLHEVAAPVGIDEIDSPPVRHLIEDMIQTLRDRGATMLTAPQVHHSLRIMVMEMEEPSSRTAYPESPLTVLINPETTPLGGDRLHLYDDCLSAPGLTGRVVRTRRVLVEALERNGERVSFELDGNLSALVQHGVDHLDGITFPARMEDAGGLSYRREYRRFHYKGPWDSPR